MEAIRAILVGRHDPERIAASTRRMRHRGFQTRSDVETGPEGSRTWSSWCRGLQMVHPPDRPEVVIGNTEEGLEP